MRPFIRRWRIIQEAFADNASQTMVVQAEPTAPSETSATSNNIFFPFGVKVLYCPVEAETDICFLHGLSGNRESTWTAKGQDKSWLEELLPKTIPKARILTLGFNACVVENSKRGYKPSSNRLNNHAGNCLLDLVNSRSDAIQRPIIFVVHSIGGLVCKKMILLSQRHQDSDFRDIFNSLRGVIFLGTPHQGSWLADLAKIPATVLGLFKSVSVSLLDILETENEVLEELQKEFLTVLRKEGTNNRQIDVVCFYEELTSYGRFMIVPRSSAVLDSYEDYGIAANHRDMVKYSSAEDNGFIRVSSLLKRWQKPAELPLQQNTSLPNPTLKLRNVVAGDDSTQVLHAPMVDAKGIKAGNNSIQIFGFGSQLDMLHQAISGPSMPNNGLVAAQDEEKEVVAVSSSSSTIR